MSFILTEPQILARTKRQTRRLGWLKAKAGDVVRGVHKCQGLKPGEHPRQLAIVEFVSVRREQLRFITQRDVIEEGFPDLSPAGFVEMFCAHNWCAPSTVVTRIEFKYVEER